MKKLCCKDINPNTPCDYEATGDTVSEVAKQMLGHARMAHSEDIEDMTNEQVIDMLESKVHE